VSLPWHRMDVGAMSHPKVLDLLNDRAPAATKYRAVVSWVASIGWSTEHETDGRIPTSAFPYIHATDATARLLVKFDLWEEGDLGSYRVHNYAKRNPLARTVDQLREDRRLAGAKSACRRWHGTECWVDGVGCSRT
jgi:hypothetical protein